MNIPWQRRITALILLVAGGLAATGWSQSADRAGASPPTRTEAAPSRTGINYWDPVEFMRRGGPLMWPILLCSVVSMTFGLERFISLRRGRVIPQGFVRRFLTNLKYGELDRERALQLCEENGSPTAAIFHAALRYWGRPMPEVEQAISEAGTREIALLRRNLRALQASANAATLLGLLGTVIGMIDAFNTVATGKGLGRAELLADGIAVALLTTAFGLMVAIPSTVLYNYFASRVERLVYEIDCVASEVADEIAAEVRTEPGSKLSARSPANTKVTPKYIS